MTSALTKRSGARIELTLRWAGRPRTLALRPWAGMLLLLVLPILAAWYLCASLYLVFHDDLLASLIARQTDQQYAYEDRISSLKAELEAATVRDGADDGAQSAALRELLARGAKLEARAATLDTLVADGLGMSNLDRSVGREPAPLAPVVRRLSTLEPNAATPPRTATGDRRLDAGAASLDRAETDQAAAVRRLRDPVLQKLARLKAALAETGLARWRGETAEVGLGGPFVPLTLPVSMDESISLLGDAVREQTRLSRIVDTEPLRRPLDGPLEVTSPFGPRLDPFLGRPAMHTGIDLHESGDDTVKATAAGTVTHAGPDGGYGNMVEIDHGDGLSTRYAHLLDIDVAAGQHVEAGERIGQVGATGRATGPHLHYETRVAGEPVDPSRFLKAAAILDPQ